MMGFDQAEKMALAAAEIGVKLQNPLLRPLERAVLKAKRDSIQRYQAECEARSVRLGSERMLETLKARVVRLEESLQAEADSSRRPNWRT